MLIKSMALIDTLKSRLIGSIDVNNDLSDEQLKDIISEMISEEYSGSDLKLTERLRLTRELFNSIRGLDALQEILEDKEITEIMINGPENIFIEKRGRLSKYPAAFSSEERLNNVIQTIVGRANKRVNESSPIVDTRLPDGSRVNVVLKPIAINGPAVTIRKFPDRVITMDNLISFGSITNEAADFLRELVQAGYNIFISGGTGSGKTTFLNALSGYIPKDERIVTIEDSAELKLEGISNLVSLECRQANVEGENEVNIRDLIRTALRMRPSRIIVGEVRGAEALDMLQAMNTGHDGSLSTGHANSPSDMLIRLETLVLMGSDMPLDAVKRQIASALDILIHLERLRNGSRVVSEITEVLAPQDGVIRLNPLFKLTGGASEPVLKNTGGRLLSTVKLGHAQTEERK